MHLSLACLSTLAVLSASLAFAQSAPPLIDLPLAGSLANRGSLGGDATLAVYAPGEAAVFDDGALGECLDFTQASRHGGVFGQDTTPAGGAVVFPGDKLAGLETFAASSGSPVLPQAYAYLDLKLVHTFAAGDHTLFVGEVGEAKILHSESRPLIFKKSDFF